MARNRPDLSRTRPNSDHPTWSHGGGLRQAHTMGATADVDVRPHRAHNTRPGPHKRNTSCMRRARPRGPGGRLDHRQHANKRASEERYSATPQHDSNSTRIRRVWQAVVRSRTNLTNMWPKSIKLGQRWQEWAKFDPTVAKLGRCWKVTNVGQRLAKFATGHISVKLGRSWPNPGHISANVGADAWAMFGQCVFVVHRFRARSGVRIAHLYGFARTVRCASPLRGVRSGAGLPENSCRKNAAQHMEGRCVTLTSPATYQACGFRQLSLVHHIHDVCLPMFAKLGQTMTSIDQFWPTEPRLPIEEGGRPQTS